MIARIFLETKVDRYLLKMPSLASVNSEYNFSQIRKLRIESPKNSRRSYSFPDAFEFPRLTEEWVSAARKRDFLLNESLFLVSKALSRRLSVEFIIAQMGQNKVKMDRKLFVIIGVTNGNN